MSLKSSLKNWEGLAQRDPLWSILTAPDKKNRQWNQDDFFKTGRLEIDSIIKLLQEKKIVPIDYNRALDFGCGVGRLTRALRSYFDEVVGLDASKTMVDEARKLNSDDKISFIQNEDPRIPGLMPGSFSFIFTTIVLQHIPYPYSVQYISSMIKLLKPGGLFVFQIPTEDIRVLSIKQKIKTTLKLRERLAHIGIGKGFHMDMYCVTDREIREVIEKSEGQLLDMQYSEHTLPYYDGNLKFIDRELCVDFVSNLYIVTKM